MKTLPWLKANLGSRCTAPLTSTDAKALEASAGIMELYAYHRTKPILEAFRIVVSQMQPHTRYLAFHLIAKVMDWSDRRSVWIDSGLAGADSSDIPTSRCKFE